MYGTNVTLPTNRMLSYNSALHKWGAINPIRGRSDQNTRPLARRGNDNLTIRLEETTNDVVVRLYSTDIVRYNEGGAIVLDPYPSALTNRVMWSILGPHVNTHWSDTNLITEVGGRYYNTPSFAVVQPAESGWTLVDGSRPVEVPYLNRKEARQALRDANYNTFKVWLDTKIRLNLCEFGHRWGTKPFDWTPRTAVQYLTQGETGWAEITATMCNKVPVEAELRSLREAVYKYHMCYDSQSVAYFESYTAMKNAMNQIRKHG